MSKPECVSITQYIPSNCDTGPALRGRPFFVRAAGAFANWLSYTCISSCINACFDVFIGTPGQTSRSIDFESRSKHQSLKNRVSCCWTSTLSLSSNELCETPPSACEACVAVYLLAASAACMTSQSDKSAENFSGTISDVSGKKPDMNVSPRIARSNSGQSISINGSYAFIFPGADLSNFELSHNQRRSFRKRFAAGIDMAERLPEFKITRTFPLKPAGLCSNLFLITSPARLTSRSNNSLIRSMTSESK